MKPNRDNLKDILLTHNYDYIIKPIISDYNQDSLTDVFNIYPNTLNYNVLDWYKKEVECINFFAHENCIKIDKVNNDWRGGTVFNLKYQPICDYEADYYLLHNVSSYNLLDYIEQYLETNLEKYYDIKTNIKKEDKYKYWFKCKINNTCNNIGKDFTVY